jgi:hypothetical protein
MPRRRQHLRLRLVLTATITLSLWCAGSPARAADPVFVGWTAALPAFTWQYNPNSSDACVAGQVSCVRRTIKTMQQRFDPLAATCVHSAVFGLAYLLTTQAYLTSSTTAGFYNDPRFVNHEDAAFAAMYFTAYDKWTRGRLAYVPPAWRIAFDAGARKQVSGMGDLLLGMNAHVNRDLPFVLAKIGLVAPDGTSRKADHDKVNVMLNRVVQPLMAEEAARFDPDIDSARTPYGVGYTALLQALVGWREAAWRQAERLVTAPNAAARAQVADSIETTAATEASAIIASTSYVPPLTTTASRDRYCAVHGQDGS